MASSSARRLPSRRAARAECVLCVADNAASRALAEQILASSPGVELALAARGRTGIELGQERLPDLALADLTFRT